MAHCFPLAGESNGILQLRTKSVLQFMVCFSDCFCPVLGGEEPCGELTAGDLVQQVLELLGREALHLIDPFHRPDADKHVASEGSLVGGYGSLAVLLVTPEALYEPCQVVLVFVDELEMRQGVANRRCWHERAQLVHQKRKRHR